MAKKSSTRRFALCVNNEGYAASLERRKVYRLIPDATAEAHKMVRVIDESGEDYLFPAKLFVPIELPLAARRALAAAS